MSVTQFVILVLVILTVAALYIFGTYQELTSLRDRLDKALAQLRSQRKHRDALVADNAEEIVTLETQIASTHQRYSDAVMKYNAYKHKRPTVWVANLTGHGADAHIEG